MVGWSEQNMLQQCESYSACQNSQTHRFLGVDLDLDMDKDLDGIEDEKDLDDDDNGINDADEL